MIKSFKDKDTEKVYNRLVAIRWINISKQAFKRLVMLDEADSLEKLKTINGSRLHKLKDEYEGYWSISINKQYRIIFEWANGNAYNVEICDYH